MNTYIILFPQKLDNENLFNALIDQFPDWVRLVPNHVWQIVTDDNKSTDVRFKISEKMKEYQQILPFLVMNVTRSGWASHRIDPEITDWLKKDR